MLAEPIVELFAFLGEKAIAAFVWLGDRLSDAAHLLRSRWRNWTGH